jgi:glycosyltransferase involved in cell wall biosynthesis
MHIYLVDLIGEHSGAFYYNREFRKILENRFGDAQVISNYTDSGNNSRKVFLNYYRGRFFSKLCKFSLSLFRFWIFIIQNRKDCIIFMTYGNAYELLFLLPSFLLKNLVIDVHEVISPIERRQALKPMRKFYAGLLYRKLAKAVIIHSRRTGEMLDGIGYSGKRFDIPHFSYNMKETGEQAVSLSDEQAITGDSYTEILYFGFMRASKGTGTVAELIKICSADEKMKDVKFTVAGNDPDNLMKELCGLTGNNPGSKVELKLRYIPDAELRELFMRCDHVFLPYSEVTQSGVLEMAIAFRKPVIASPLPYFTELLTMFPSFGYLSDGFAVEDYYNILARILKRKEKGDSFSFSTDDTGRFEVYKSPAGFLDELSDFLKS